MICKAYDDDVYEIDLDFIHSTQYFLRSISVHEGIQPRLFEEVGQ